MPADMDVYWNYIMILNIHTVHSNFIPKLYSIHIWSLWFGTVFLVLREMVLLKSDLFPFISIVFTTYVMGDLKG